MLDSSRRTGRARSGQPADRDADQTSSRGGAANRRNGGTVIANHDRFIDPAFPQSPLERMSPQFLAPE